jgi:hypothetical protein
MNTTLFINPGDRVVVPKGGLPGVQHHGIYAGKNDSEQHVFVHNMPGIGVHATTDVDFFRGASMVTRVVPFTGTSAERNRALTKAINRIGSRYNLLSYNCEHFSNDVQTGKPQSIQVRNVLIILFCALIVFWLYTKAN